MTPDSQSKQCPVGHHLSDIIIIIIMINNENGVASVSKSLCCSIAHHTTFTRSLCCTQRSWWTTESSPVYASPRGEDPEGRMTEFVNARDGVSLKTLRGRTWETTSLYIPRICLMKPLKKKSNDVNDLIWIPGRVASGRGGSGASSVVIQQNSCQINRNQKKKKDLKNKIQLGTRNVHTMLRPGKLTSVIREMKRANLDVMGLAETRWKEEIDFTSEGVRIIHTGGENGQNGVAVLVEEKIARSIVEIERYGSRMIEVKIKAEPVDIVIIQVYTPTTNHEEEEVENMYERLEEVLDRTKGADYVVIMGDCNAVVGEGADRNSIEKYGLGKRNNRSEKLTELCNRRELVITNTWFQHEKRRRYTWKALGDVARFQLDYIWVKQRYRNSVKNARAMPGADADTGHNLVIMRAQIELKFIKRKKTIKHRWNNKNLKERSNELGRKIEENLTESEGNSIEERWKRLKDNIIESAMDIVGAKERMPARKPWITKEMVDEMEERRKWKH